MQKIYLQLAYKIHSILLHNIYLQVLEAHME